MVRSGLLFAFLSASTCASLTVETPDASQPPPRDGGCEPYTCAGIDAECGSLPNGCGGTLDCGQCAAPQTCGGGGPPHLCGCMPRTCAELSKNCGKVDDGCGVLLDCGTCTAPLTCGAGGMANVCGTGTCVKKTCADLGKNCGTVSDGCSATLDCGTCTGSQACGGGGTANVCGCLPKTCAQLGKNCGMASDGCGGMRDCGVCSGSDTCGGGGTPNVCSCIPKTCAQLGKNCGMVGDGCGAMRDCGACTVPQTCGGGGTANVCGCTPKTCAELGKNCGMVADGCGGMRDCGMCTSPQTCGGAGNANVCGQPGDVSFTQNQFGVTFTNLDASWVIYTGCFGPSSRGGQNLTVGPGYIARVVLKRPAIDGQTVIVNDEAPDHDAAGNALSASNPGTGGLGSFGWHHARGTPPFNFTGNNAWEIHGRFCAADHGNFGVQSAQVVEPASIDASGVGHLSIDVFFSDGWTQSAPLMRVRYRYRVFPDVVKVWAVVTAHCDNGNCGSGAPGAAFIKEPKFKAGVLAGGFTRLAIINDQGAIVTNSASTNPTCVWMGTNPMVSTGQCDGDFRARGRFDFGALDSGIDGKCDSTSRFCLNAVMRAYPNAATDDVTPGGVTSPWEGVGFGPDNWAVLYNARAQVNSADSPNGGAQWACHGGSPSNAQQRRWELEGGAKNASGQYVNAGFGFHLWEGGTGAYDCEPLSRRFGPDGERFSVHAQYSINSGWGLQ